MRLSSDSTCSYHMCDQSGHSVCKVVYSHYARLVAALAVVLQSPDSEIPGAQGPTLRAILAENPGTSTTT
jgi:hypothetical protein